MASITYEREYTCEELWAKITLLERENAVLKQNLIEKEQEVKDLDEIHIIKSDQIAEITLKFENLTEDYKKLEREQENDKKIIRSLRKRKIEPSAPLTDKKMRESCTQTTYSYKYSKSFFKYCPIEGKHYLFSQREKLIFGYIDFSNFDTFIPYIF